MLVDSVILIHGNAGRSIFCGPHRIQFIIDSKQNLKVSPQDQMVYYLQQNVAMLDQISRQISSIAPQLSIPSAPPARFPDFKPSASDIRVNVFWFMALIFSLSAALIATLVQQWVRDYMHVFQRYSDPLRRARLRQYLLEGTEGSYMLVSAEAVPGLLHVSLFLFFVGLCDFIFNINTKVALTTATPIAITGLLYTFTTIAPVINPQWPYRNSFSGLLWYTLQKFGRRQYKDRGPRPASTSLSSKMAEGQMQLAMEETKDREGRDIRAIRWLVSNATEGAGMESLAVAIRDLFYETWGMEMWRKIFLEDRNRNTGRNEPGPSRMRSIFYWFIPMVRSRAAGVHTQEEDALGEFSARIGRLLDSCTNQSLFASTELWQRRTRASIETTALLVCLTGVKLSHFGDVIKALGAIGKGQTIRESSSVGTDQPFVMDWTCLSLVAIRPILESNLLLRNDARLASQRLERRDNTDDEEQTPTRIDKIMETMNKALRGLKTISDALTWGGDQTQERVKEILRDHRYHISELEQLDIENAGFQLDDWSISSVQQSIDQITHGIMTRQLPGIVSDLSDTESVDVGQFVELFRDPHALLLVFPLRNLRRIQSFAKTLRNILEERHDALEERNDADAFQKAIKNLREFGSLPNRLDKQVLRQVWRLQDLSGGGGLGFTVELFFLALEQLLSTSPSKESHSELFIGTFHAITSDWSKYKNSLGTQRLLLNMAAPHRGIIFGFDYPGYIMDKFLAFLGDILDGQTGPHIDDVAQQLSHFPTYLPRHALSVKALNAITRTRASSS
jgi:hypothetical protein